MTLTLATEKKGNLEVALEYEKFGALYARVYEEWGGEWHKTNESRPYKDEKKAKASFRRFVKKYLA